MEKTFEKVIEVLASVGESVICQYTGGGGAILLASKVLEGEFLPDFPPCEIEKNDEKWLVADAAANTPYLDKDGEKQFLEIENWEWYTNGDTYYATCND